MVLTNSKYYIPQGTILVSEISAQFGRTFQIPEFGDADEYTHFLRTVLKLESVRQENHLNQLEMLFKVVEEVVSKVKAAGEVIDGVIIAETHYSPQDLAKLVQQRFGIERCYSAVISGNHCANFEIAINVACALLKAEKSLHNILVAGSVTTPDVGSRIIGSYAVLGDAAGATVISRGAEGISIVDQTFISTGALHDAKLGVGQSLFHAKYYLTLLTELFDRNPGCKERISRIVTQNANSLLVGQCIAASGLSKGKVFCANVGRYGHLHCLDFIVNLTDLLAEGRVQRGEIILAIGSGWNGSYVGTLMELV